MNLVFITFYIKNIFKKNKKNLQKKFNIDWKLKKTKKAIKKLNSANLIRIKNSSKKIEDIKSEIIEFILIDLIVKFYKKIFVLCLIILFVIF